MVKSRILIVLFATLLTAISAECPAQEIEPSKAKPTRRFQEWDRNRDGRLTRDELPPNLRRNFDRVDKDNDGFISPAEDAAFTGKNGNPQPAKIDGVNVLSDLAYVDDKNPRHRLDLFLPEKPKSNAPLPLLAFIHGGGWRGGDKRSGTSRIARLVKSGHFAGASIGYRLSNEAKWPAQIHDCKAAIRWLKANAKEHGFDAQRIAVWGTSAGGHLVAMLGVTGNIPQLEGTLGKHTTEDSRVACVVNFFGPTDFLSMNNFKSNIDHDAPNSPESLLIGAAIQENKQKARAACPLMYVTRDDAPMLLMHGDKDLLVPFDQSVQLAAALKSKNVPHYLVKIENGGHGFPDEKTKPRVRQFLQRHLFGQKQTEVNVQPIVLPARKRQDNPIPPSSAKKQRR